MAGTAVVLLEAYGAAALVLLFKAQYVFDRRAAELVDALVVVAHDADVPPALRQHRGEHVLQVVRILILVDEDVFELALIVLQHVLVLLEETDGVIQQVVEVHGPGGKEPGGVGLVDIRYLPQARVRRIAVLRSEGLRREQLVPGGVQPGEDGLRRIDLVVQVHLPDDGLHDREPV